MAFMNIGIIGLGKMGVGIATRILKAGYTVYGYDPSQEAKNGASHAGIKVVEKLSEIGQQVSVVWLMIPAGTLIDTVLATLLPTLQPGTIVIDGGNSLYTDSVRRAEQLSKQNMPFLDCGTSGGIHGVKHGFCLMVGGSADAYTKTLPILKAIASLDGVAHVGPSGAGHYVKMVHNGIEYGLLQAYAEGFHLLKEGSYKDLDMHQIAALWNTSSVIRSFILTLATDIFAHDQELKNIVGTIAESGMGQWTVDNAHKENIPLNVIETALNIRAESRKTDGNYATKVVALLREQFGGHAVERKSEEQT